MFAWVPVAARWACGGLLLAVVGAWATVAAFFHLNERSGR